MESDKDDDDFENQILQNNIHKINERINQVSPPLLATSTPQNNERIRNQVILNKIRRDEFMKTLPYVVNCPPKSTLIKMGFRDEDDIDGINQIEEIQQKCNKNKYKSFAKSIKKEKKAYDKYQIKPPKKFKEIIETSENDPLLNHLKYTILQNYSNKLIKKPNERKHKYNNTTLSLTQNNIPIETEDILFDKSSTSHTVKENIYIPIDEYDIPPPTKIIPEAPNVYMSTYNSTLPSNILGHFSSHNPPTHQEKLHIKNSKILLENTLPLYKTPYRSTLQPKFINNNNTIVIYINSHGHTTRQLLSTELNKIIQMSSKRNNNPLKKEEVFFTKLKNISSSLETETENWLKTNYISWLLTMTGRINTTDDTDLTAPQLFHILNILYKNLIIHGIPTMRDNNAEPISYIIYKSLAYALNKEHLPAEDKSYIYQHYLANYNEPKSWLDLTEHVNYYLNDGGLPHILKYDIEYSSPVQPLPENYEDSHELPYQERVGLLFSTPDIDRSIVNIITNNLKQISRNKFPNHKYKTFYLSELLSLAYRLNVKIHIIDSACQLFLRNQLPKNESENIQLNNQQIYNAFESPMLYGVFPNTSNVNNTVNIKIALEHLHKTDSKLNTSNILTYTTLLKKYGDRMDHFQRNWVNEQISNLQSSSSTDNTMVNNLGKGKQKYTYRRRSLRRRRPGRHRRSHTKKKNIMKQK